jgi:Zn-dependent protease with chaperone function
MGDSLAMLDAAPAVRTQAQAPKQTLVAIPTSASVPGFSGEFEPTLVSTGYKIGLAVAAVGMGLLLAVYAALIGFASYGVYYHLKEHSAMIKDYVGYTTLFLYLWPAAAGVVLVFFMIKPIFAGRPEQPPKYSLTAQSDPVLFAFITRICQLVKAPLPSRVDVDCDINASASLRRGLLSLRGNDIVLTIGLPLAAGLTMQEFAGVLAHEFGHFAQGAGMKLTYIIRLISSWFARVVYERDEWDVGLAKAAHSVDIRIGIFLHMIRLAVWLTRRILWIFMRAGHAISCFMLRQMEYDADTYETKLSGSQAFAATTAKFQALLAAGQWTSQKMDESWRNRRLPADLPSFISVSVKNVPADLKKKWDEKLAKKKTRLLDTHPCDNDRIKAALALNEAGVFHSNEPATRLFKDFAELSRAATRFHYEHNLELRITEHNLVAHEVAERESRSQAEGDQSMRDFFFGVKLVFRAIPYSEEPPQKLPLGELIETSKKAKQAMESAKPQVQKALAEYQEAESLYQRGLDAIRQEAQQASEKASVKLRELIPLIEPFENNARVRLECGLLLLNDPEIAARVSEAELLRGEAARLRIVLARLSEAFGPLQALRRKFSALMAAIDVCNEPKRSGRVEQAERRINELKPELEGLIKDVRAPLQDVPYPFHHAREEITVDQFARNDIPASNKLQALVNDCNCQLNRLLPLYQRVLARLAFISLKVEEVI